MVSLGDKKYQKGKIYFIGNYVDNDIYIGSTTQTLKRRFNKHKIQIDNDKTKHRKLYAKMIELGVECFYIEEIEKCPCNDVEELQKRERHYILERKPVLNIQIPLRTMEEWRRDSQEHLQEYERQRYINNPRKEYKKQYREDNKDKLDENTKRFREENPDYMKEYNQKYYQEKKDYFKEYRENNRDKYKEKIKCECGKVITRGSISRHCKTKKHKDYLNNINIENVSSTQEETNNTELQETNEQTSRETIGAGDV